MFSPGDRVRCIGMDPGYESKLEVGKIYVVRSEDDGWISVEDDPNDEGEWNDITYESHYFEPEDPTNTVQYCIQGILKTVPRAKVVKCSESET